MCRAVHMKIFTLNMGKHFIRWIQVVSATLNDSPKNTL